MSYRLNQLANRPGARKGRVRVGRGIGCGKGKTGGRGVKGQKSRSGVAIKGFEGGQMPIYRRLPKRGFVSPAAKDFAIVNLDALQAAVDGKKLDANKEITSDMLRATGVVSRSRDGVRVLGRGTLKTALRLNVEGASAAAVAAVEDAGGTVVVKSAGDGREAAQAAAN